MVGGRKGYGLAMEYYIGNRKKAVDRVKHYKRLGRDAFIISKKQGKKARYEIAIQREFDVKNLKDIKHKLQGDKYNVIVNNPKIGKRKVTFEYTGKKGFGMFKILKNVEVE